MGEGRIIKKINVPRLPGKILNRKTTKQNAPTKEIDLNIIALYTWFKIKYLGRL